MIGKNYGNIKKQDVNKNQMHVYKLDNKFWIFMNQIIIKYNFNKNQIIQWKKKEKILKKLNNDNKEKQIKCLNMKEKCKK